MRHSHGVNTTIIALFGKRDVYVTSVVNISADLVMYFQMNIVIRVLTNSRNASTLWATMVPLLSLKNMLPVVHRTLKITLSHVKNL